MSDDWLASDFSHQQRLHLGRCTPADNFPGSFRSPHTSDDWSMPGHDEQRTLFLYCDFTI
ncbi:hypothetical protein JMJ77_0013623 [Colletotrichum scovillei]|uniref:Uncharacterized protein n=1 Tax=Colletotrichum scovillei TaxID=1209932 RepID=A0A9P7QUT6_9PEZI|nr:hypothetical protein JMJ78_0012911 [Colletotrichum scovillei]KAG7040626.1 hypothetical protein JMJ77_0013623 [Colletotrichum scovillei]KAG7060673.1 hypothetical protein JMJ76_0006216 [Colletotrichum scovillei]